jgi:hypothetical protein
VAKHADYCNPELSENTDEREQAAGNGARVRLMLLMGDLDLGLLCGDGESERVRSSTAQHNMQLFDPAKPGSLRESGISRIGPFNVTALMLRGLGEMMVGWKVDTGIIDCSILLPTAPPVCTTLPNCDRMR